MESGGASETKKLDSQYRKLKDTAYLLKQRMETFRHVQQKLDQLDRATAARLLELQDLKASTAELNERKAQLDILANTLNRQMEVIQKESARLERKERDLEDLRLSLEEERGSLEERAAEMAGKTAKTSQELMERERDLVEREASLAQKERELSEREAELSDAEKGRAETLRQIARLSEETMKNLERVKEHAELVELRLAELEEARARQREAAHELDEERRSLSLLYENLTLRLSDAERFVDAMPDVEIDAEGASPEELDALNGKIAELEEEVARLTAELDTRPAVSEEERRELETLKTRLIRRKKELDERELELDMFEGELDERKKGLDQSEENLKARLAELEEKEAALDERLKAAKDVRPIPKKDRPTIRKPDYGKYSANAIDRPFIARDLQKTVDRFPFLVVISTPKGGAIVSKALVETYARDLAGKAWFCFAPNEKTQGLVGRKLPPTGAMLVFVNGTLVENISAQIFEFVFPAVVEKYLN